MLYLNLLFIIQKKFKAKKFIYMSDLHEAVFRFGRAIVAGWIVGNP